jgi:hypothetical protein
MTKEDNWEADLNKNMESIRKSTASIKNSYNAIMGLMVIVVSIEIAGMIL